MKNGVVFRHLISSVMIVYVNVLRSIIIDVVVCEYNERLVVSENWNRDENIVEILSQFDQPNSFCRCE